LFTLNEPLDAGKL